MFDKKHKRYIKDCRSVFNTESGKRVLAHLKSMHIIGSCLDSSPELTYYRLGQAELVQSLLNIVGDDREIEEIMRDNEYV